MYDIVIVGGGPAGLTAAVYALRGGRSVVVIEKNGFGGQIAFSPKVENIPGTIQISGAEFADKLVEQVVNLGADLELRRAAPSRARLSFWHWASSTACWVSRARKIWWATASPSAPCATVPSIPASTPP